MTMRLPTIAQFKNEVAQMAKQHEKVSILQAQVSSGKKLLKSSDDPLTASRVGNVTDYIDRIKSYEVNTTLAENRLLMVNSSLQQGIDLSSRAQELVVRAQSETLNNRDRQNIAEELRAVLERMVMVANTQDSHGEYIYNGFQVSTPAYSLVGGEYHYQGGYEGYSIEIGEGTQVLYNDSGFQVFGNIKSGNGFYSVAADALNNTGTGYLNSVSVQNSQDSSAVDDYSIKMVMNASGKLGYQILGKTHGQVVPLPPLILPDDAPEYVVGSTITFNGISVILNGQPEAGDTFKITPSKVQNVFKTLQNLIDALNAPVASEADKAILKQTLVEESESFAQASDHLIIQLTNAGNRAKMIDDQAQLNKNQIIDEQIILSRLSDVDMTQSISELTQRLTSLNIMQQSYLKIQETFIQLLNH